MNQSWISSAGRSINFFSFSSPSSMLSISCERILFCLPAAEATLRDRSRGVSFLNELVQRADDRMVSLMESGLGKKRTRREGEGIDPNLLAGVPIFLRDLLARLPPHTGPPPDIDTFLDHLKKTVLPPRPVTEEQNENASGGIIFNNSILGQHVKSSTEDDVILLTGSKRKVNFDGEDDDEDEAGRRADDDSRDDIFKQRCRLRMSME
jgi:hypothetical protein